MAAIEIRNTAELVWAKWPWFLLLGIVLIVAGAAAFALPVLARIAASVVLGIVLAVVGVVKIVEGLQVKQWAGSVWQLLLGAVEVVGGILIYLNPLKGALAITLLIAVIFLVQGLLQIALAFRLRPQEGWGWMVLAGLVSLAVTVTMVMKVRYTNFYTPGTVAGIALMAAGWAYVVIALANRRARRARLPA
jgi:uncharacterized membrane protein HdeD (DUF308 family)